MEVNRDLVATTAKEIRVEMMVEVTETRIDRVIEAKGIKIDKVIEAQEIKTTTKDMVVKVKITYKRKNKNMSKITTEDILDPSMLTELQLANLFQKVKLEIPLIDMAKIAITNWTKVKSKERRMMIKINIAMKKMIKDKATTEDREIKEGDKVKRELMRVWREEIDKADKHKNLMNKTMKSKMRVVLKILNKEVSLDTLIKEVITNVNLKMRLLSNNL